jgi:TonB family protein
MLSVLGHLCVLCVFVVSVALAQEEPKVAGTDVPAPKRSHFVVPKYPGEAQAQGAHGIVVIEIVIDTQGKIASARVLRSIPLLDEAALSAVRQWEYEITKVDGKPVSVKMTIPITFSMKLPEVTRQAGIPELRQGSMPAYPQGVQASGRAQVVVEVSLEPDGTVGDAEIRSGQPPFSEALLRAVRSWRFEAPGSTSISFRIEADFIPSEKNSPAHVELHLTGVQQSESASNNAPAPMATSTPPTPEAGPLPPSEAPQPSSPPAAGTSTPPPAASTPPAAAPSPTPPPAVAPPVSGVEIIPGKPRPRPEGSGGISSIQGVTVAPGLPDLVKGRRPIVPPLARMSGASGSVEVRFAVDASGVSSVQSSDGPDVLKPAAEQTVASWFFQRGSTERLHLIAVLTYEGNSANARVRTVEEPPTN